ncbi:hypothetical protein [Candidatus Nitrospira neomarina]|uniref:Uncharacterized protein n=1 Tax=Candidatus Nitrospira neomarina TaxID=3020899 RepID=A0AA96K0H6_9BACT|nr:hypothetical protein [Candidatus Nitrospira neomarina]WNM62086.1 hypothetical protein PQG83_20455 [Candidatus Nitrospira neomarina]
MSTSSELMYAILAMDAYNRGYDPGMVLTGSQIGRATIPPIQPRNFVFPGLIQKTQLLTKPPAFMRWRMSGMARP